MRRSDREVSDNKKIDQIINKCHCCRLGFYDQGKVYIVPLSFGYIKNKDKRIFYFHSAKEGRKIDLIKKTPVVGFEMDTNYKLQTGKTACQYTATYQSLIGNGKLSFVEEILEKKAGLQAIMFQNTNKDNWEFSDQMLITTCVFKLVITEISGKEHL